MKSNKKSLNVAKIIENSYANGPGVRMVIWFQGCNFHCKGCYNKELWPFIQKNKFTPEELANKVLESESIEGITLTGGEPLLQYLALLEFLKLIKDNGLSVVCFTGYKFKDIAKLKMKDILNYIDIVIAGPYIEELSTSKMPLISSSNQELIFLTGFYSKEDLKDEEMVEIFIDDKEIQVTGFPTKKFIDEVLL